MELIRLQERLEAQPETAGGDNNFKTEPKNTINKYNGLDLLKIQKSYLINKNVPFRNNGFPL